MFVGAFYHAIRYLERFGIPRIEYSGLGRLRPRRVHRHASGAAQGKVGALPALNHKPELSAGRYRPDAIRLYEHRFIVRAHHKLKWARMVVLGSGLLYERVPCSESDAAIIAARPRRDQKVHLKGGWRCRRRRGFLWFNATEVLMRNKAAPSAHRVN